MSFNAEAVGQKSVRSRRRGVVTACWDGATHQPMPFSQAKQARLTGLKADAIREVERLPRPARVE
jgi:hypothetical protein